MSISLGRKLIKSMNGKSYNVTRSASGSYNDSGIYVPGAQTTVTVLASVQPLNGKEIASIPEGDRDLERKKLYSADQMFISEEGIGRDADVITIDGKAFKAESVEPWTNYWKVIVVTVNKPEGVMP